MLQKSSALLVPEFSDFSNTFEVEIKRNSLGLGFSICGGPEAPAPWTNLIRVKKIFPLQPAWESGRLRVGDILLRVCGVPLTGLNLLAALDILRSTPCLTGLQVCRVSDNSGNSWGVQQLARPHLLLRSYSCGPAPAPPSLPLVPATSMDIEISPPSPASPAGSEREWSPAEEESGPAEPVLCPLEPHTKLYGEFTVVLRKVNGSLGFTLRQLDDTVLKHTVKALVKEPALSDGRIQPGDKLLSCNGVELAEFSHQELISFLRQAPEENQLTLYRDASRSGTPLSPDPAPALHWQPLSLPGPARLQDKRTSQSPSRKHLRYEAAELVRSLQSSRTSLEKAGLAGSGSYSTGTLGRRLGRPYSPGLQPRHLLSPASPTVESPVTPHNSSAPASLSQGVTTALQGLSIEEVDSRESPDSLQCTAQHSPDIQEAVSVPQSPASAPQSPASAPQSPASAPKSPSADPPSHAFISNQSKSLPRGSTNHYLISSSGSIYTEKPERPSDLNFNSQNRKQGYIFNNSCDDNKNKF